jgi:hypothetical protein
MSCAKMSTSLVRSLVRHRLVLKLACALLLAAPAANALDSGDIVVVSSKGEVYITVNGTPRKLPAGAVLEPPATVRTGRDGNIELRQGATSVNVGPETLLEFPALEKRGAPIDRIQQPRGNAFYNIGKRDGRKLRVETPYLVAVIKGTQFNVAAQDESTTISLFEGLLEVHASDDSDVVDLKAGEIAARRRGEDSITTIRMDAGKALPSAPRAPAGSSSNLTPSPVNPRVAPSSDGPTDEGPSDDGNASLLVDREINSTDLHGIGTSRDAGVTANPSVNPGSSGVEVPTNVAGDVGPVADPVSADSGVSAAVDVVAGAVDTSVGPGVDTGLLTTEVAADTAVDPQVEVPVGADGAAAPVAGVEPDLGVDLADDVDNSGPGSEDDGNNGHGNDDDNLDSSNPGNANNSGSDKK